MAPKSFQNGARWGGESAPCFRAWRGLGGVLGPLGAQEAPRADFNRFLIDFRWILVDFWKIFQWFFYDFYDGCHSCLISQVIMNVVNFLLYVSLCVIFQWLVWWLSSSFDTAAHHECFNLCLCVSFCVRFLGNRCSCMLGSEKLETGLLYSSKKQVMFKSGDTCMTYFFKACGMANPSTSLLGKMQNNAWETSGTCLC